tara:strand:+ start:5076 stop:5816 length:741 start_codon:yes stop_codon:yes gene_type:complete
VKNYCKKYDIDYVQLTEPKLAIEPDPKRHNRNKVGLMKEAGERFNRPGFLPIFEKEWAFTYLDDYDQICIIDADIYVRESAPNIFDELPEEYDFGGMVERDQPLTHGHLNKIKTYSEGMFKGLKDVDWKWNKGGAEFMNMGLMLFNKSLGKHLNGQTPEQFIRRPEFKDMVDGIGLYRYSTDQVLLNYWLKKSGAKVKNLSWKWNAMYRGTKEDKISQAYFIHFFLKDHLPNKGEDINQIKKILGV